MTTYVFGKRRCGFSLIELGVVILVVFVLIGMVLVALKIERDTNRPIGPSMRAWTENKLKNLSLACLNANHFFKTLPPAFDKYGQMKFSASVHVHLLPYVGPDNLYKMFLEQKDDGDLPRNVAVKQYDCFEDYTQIKDGKGVQNFAANLRVFSDKGMATEFDANVRVLTGIEPGKASIPGSFPDGLSNTIFFTTKLANCQDGGSRYVAAPDSKFAAFFGQNAATAIAHSSDPRSTFQLMPLPKECLIAPLMAQSMSDHGISVALGDGSVRFINPNISPRTWNQLLQPNDGLEIRDDW
jgi:hypothetical protein